jgi:hypothetical protein
MEKETSVTIRITMDENTQLISATIMENTTELKSNSDLLKNLSFAMLRNLIEHKEKFMIQDVLNELNIPLQK